jgi:hypothetical protein
MLLNAARPSLARIERLGAKRAEAEKAEATRKLLYLNETGKLTGVPAVQVNMFIDDRSFVIDEPQGRNSGGSQWNAATAARTAANARNGARRLHDCGGGGGTHSQRNDAR